jgi:hypothetical protein
MTAILIVPSLGFAYEIGTRSEAHLNLVLQACQARVALVGILGAVVEVVLRPVVELGALVVTGGVEMVVMEQAATIAAAARRAAAVPGDLCRPVPRDVIGRIFSFLRSLEPSDLGP